jgi:diguanylate cyclase
MIDVALGQTALQQLSRAEADHQRWYSEIVRTIVCRLPSHGSDVADDAHRQCRFGQWYDGAVLDEVRAHPVFGALGGEHERMHRLAARLLRASERDAAVPSSTYDEFDDARASFGRKLSALKSEIADVLYGHDPLTGAESRIGMGIALRDALELAKRHVTRYCVAVMDLDRFKEVNDTYGHHVGDQVLVAAVRHIAHHMRPYDKVFRYGGDEFLIVMPTTDLQAAQAVIERICGGLASMTVSHDDGAPIAVTASFGMTALDPGVGITESIARADSAMYAAKAAGRNRVCVWEPATPDIRAHLARPR